MKNLILILAFFSLFASCNKNKKSVLNPTVYCMFTEDGGTHIFRGCAETKADMQRKMVELRDQGFTVVNYKEKNTCSECQ